MKFTELQMKWIEDNPGVFAINSSATEADRLLVYEMYNHIFDTSKKPNSCGRCWRNVKAAVYTEYQKNKNT